MKQILMTKKNEEGKEIKKYVPENIYSIYVATGWTIVKENKENKAYYKPENKEDK